MSKQKPITITVPSDITATRLDLFLSGQSELELTRNKAQQLIESGNVLVNGNAVTKNHKVKGNETITLTLPEARVFSVDAEAIPLRVAYEDEYLAIIDKPAGMVTHPAAGNYSGTLVNALMHRYKQLPGQSKDRLGIVHRLDKETSGLLVIAKTEAALAKLQPMIAAREIAREYRAIVCGHMKEENGVINMPIGRSAKDRTKMAVTSRGSRTAQTEYRLQERFRAFDYLEIHLHTGRTHQIRVHFSHLGHPILGDPEYGGREKILKGIFAPERPLVIELLSQISRQALHAAKLSFIHPFTEEKLSVESPLPDDFSAVLRILQERGH